MTRKKVAVHSAKFAKFRVEHRNASARARQAARKSIETSTEIARKKAEQFAALSAIDNSIFKERLIDHLDRSYKRIESELRKSKENARRAIRENVTTELVESEILRAQDNLRRRTIGLRSEIATSASNIQRKKRIVRHHLIQSYQGLQRKMDANRSDINARKSDFYETAIIARGTLERTRQSLISGREQLKMKIFESSASSRDASMKARPSVADERDFLQRELGQSTNAQSLEQEVASRTSSIRSNFMNQLGERKEAIEIHGRDLAQRGRATESAMRQSILNARKNYLLEVRFARSNILSSAKRFRVMGNQVVQRLGTARRAEIERARSRRKVRSIRNALLLIRTIR